MHLLTDIRKYRAQFSSQVKMRLQSSGIPLLVPLSILSLQLMSPCIIWLKTAGTQCNFSSTSRYFPGCDWTTRFIWSFPDRTFPPPKDILSPDIITPLNGRWNLSARYAMFEVESTDSRIYVYQEFIPFSILDTINQREWLQILPYV